MSEKNSQTAALMLLNSVGLPDEMGKRFGEKEAEIFKKQFLLDLKSKDTGWLSLLKSMELEHELHQYLSNGIDSFGHPLRLLIYMLREFGFLIKCEDSEKGVFYVSPESFVKLAHKAGIVFTETESFERDGKKYLSFDMGNRKETLFPKVVRKLIFLGNKEKT